MSVLCCNKEACPSVNSPDEVVTVQICLGCTTLSSEKVFYCGQCFENVHSRMPAAVRQGHRLVPHIVENLCSCDKNLPLDTYCVDCSMNICNSCCRVEPHISHQVEPLRSLSSIQKVELTELLSKVQVEEKNLEHQMSSGINSNNAKRNNIGVGKVLDDLHRRFQVLHKYLNEREEDLVSIIEKESHTCVQKGLTQFHSDIQAVTSSTANILSSYLLRSSQVSNLYEDARNNLQDSLDLFQELPSLSDNLQLTALELSYTDQVKILIGEQGQFRSLQKAAPERVKLEVIQASRTLSISWSPPVTVFEDPSPLILKYFNNEASLPPIIAYNIEISSSNAGIVAKIRHAANNVLQVSYRLDTNRLKENHTVRVQALCNSDTGIKVEGKWSNPESIVPQPWSSMPVRAGSSQSNSSQTDTGDEGSRVSKKRRLLNDDSDDSDDDSDSDDHSDVSMSKNEEHKGDPVNTHPNLVFNEKMKKLSSHNCIHREWKDIELLVENAGNASGLYKIVDGYIPERTHERTQYWLEKFSQQTFASPLWWLYKESTDETVASESKCSSKGGGVHYCLTITRREDKQYCPRVWSISIPGMDPSQIDVPLYYTYCKGNKQAGKKKPKYDDLYDALPSKQWETYPKYESNEENVICEEKRTEISVSVLRKE